MKKLIVSVIFGIVTGLLYIAMTIFMSSPLLLLSKFGLIDFWLENGVSLSNVINGIISNKSCVELSSTSIILLTIQSILCVGVGVLSFAFVKKVMKIHLPKEGYFRHLYDVVFFLLFVIPEILIILSILFNFSVLIVVSVIVVITVLVSIFAIIMSVKILPDLLKNENRRDILEEV